MKDDENLNEEDIDMDEVEIELNRKPISRAVINHSSIDNTRKSSNYS